MSDAEQAHIASRRIFLRRRDGDPLVLLGDVPPPELGPDSWIWIDLLVPSDVEFARACEAIGASTAPIDLPDEDTMSRVRVAGDSLVVITHSLTSTGERVDTTAVTAVLGEHGLVTVRFRDLPGYDVLVSRAQDNPLLSTGGPDELLARLLDVSAQRFLPLIDELEVATASLDDDAIAGEARVLGEIHALRRDASVLRGVLGPQREVLLSLSRLESPLWGSPARDRTANTFDLNHRVVESLDTARAMLTGVIEVYRGAVAEKTNEVMKVLTIFSATLLPLSVIAGIYGMNFEHMPELAWRWAYPATLAFMASVAIGLWTFFARRGFVGGPKAPRKVGRGLVHLVGAPIRVFAHSRPESVQDSRGVDEDTVRLLADAFALPWDTSRVIWGTEGGSDVD